MSKRPNIVQRALAVASNINWFGLRSGSSSWLSWLRIFAVGGIDWRKDAGSIDGNSAVQAAVQWLQRRLAEPRLIVERPGLSGGKKTMIEAPDHDLIRLIENGLYYDQAELFAGTALSLVVAGNAYWGKLRDERGRLLGFVWLPHWNIRPMNDRYNDRPGLVTYYLFHNPDGTTYDIDTRDIVHFRMGINPIRPQEGLSPVDSSLREVVTDNVAAELGACLLKNGGMAGIAWEPKDSVQDDLSPDQKRNLEDRIKARMVGPESGTPILMTYPGTWKVIGYEPDKLVLSQQRALAVSRILAPLGIDPMVLGLPSEVQTYANRELAEEGAVYNLLMPILAIIRKALDRQVLQVDYADRRFRCGWDLSNVEALADDLEKLWARIGARVDSDWMTIGAAKRATGEDPLPGEDQLYQCQLRASALPSSPTPVARARKALEMLEDDRQTA